MIGILIQASENLHNPGSHYPFKEGSRHARFARAKVVKTELSPTNAEREPNDTSSRDVGT